MHHSHKIQAISLLSWCLLLASNLSLGREKTLLQPPRETPSANGLNIFATSYYRLAAVDGEVMYRRPFSAYWLPAKVGLNLPFGTNLQVKKGANVDLNYFYRNEGAWKSLQTYVSFRNDVTLVLNEQILRKVDIKNFTFTALRAEDVTQIDPNEGKLDFQRAWNRVATYFRSEQAFSPNLKEDDDFNLNIGLRSRRISIVYPKDGLTKYSTNFPLHFLAVWDNPFNKEVAFKVYLWKYQRPMSEPLAIVRADSYRINIPEPGSYFIRVATADERYSSRPTLVHFVKDLARDSADAHIDSIAPNLLFPLKNSVLGVPKSGKAIQFLASAVVPPKAKALNLILEKSPSVDKESSQKINLKPDTFLQAFVNLKPGSYRWWLEYPSAMPENQAHGEPDSTAPVMSEKRSLTLVEDDETAKSMEAMVSTLVDDYIKNGVSSHIFISKSRMASGSSLKVKE
jgi:hypothetical protein